MKAGFLLKGYDFFVLLFMLVFYFCAFYAQNACMYTGGYVHPFTCLSSKSMKWILMKYVIWGLHLKFSGARVVGIATRQQTGQAGVRILVGARGFSLFRTSRLALGPTQPPVRWVPGFFPQGKVPGAKVNL
jgi:hypothetical protein